MGELRMPSLGADMDAGTLVTWQVAPGAHVKRGDVVALVETQKGIIEVEIWDTGVIGELVVQPGTKVPVGTLLATVVDGEAAPKGNGAAAPMEAPAAPPPAPAAAPPTPITAPPSPLSGPRASPAARQLARERGVDLTKVHGTGPHDAITRQDVEDAAGISKEAPAPVPRPTPAPPAAASAMRKAIAAAMARSKREIPHYYLGAELDVSRATRFLEDANARRPVTERVLFAAVLLKATALALREVPELNGFWIEDAYRPSERIHVGVAIAQRQGGLIAPALHDTDQKSLVEIMKGLGDLVARVRSGSLRSSELADPTITVTNLGDQGTDSVFGVIYPPQVAIVGFGTVRERPWAENGMVGARPVVAASLAADHRVTDGHRGARFLQALRRLLDEPEKL